MKILNVTKVHFTKTHVDYVVAYENNSFKTYHNNIPMTVMRFIVTAKNAETLTDGLTQYYN